MSLGQCYYRKNSLCINYQSDYCYLILRTRKLNQSTCLSLSNKIYVVAWKVTLKHHSESLLVSSGNLSFNLNEVTFAKVCLVFPTLKKYINMLFYCRKHKIIVLFNKWYFFLYFHKGGRRTEHLQVIQNAQYNISQSGKGLSSSLKSLAASGHFVGLVILQGWPGENN